MRKAFVLILVLLCMVTGCSKKDVYEENTQNSVKSESPKVEDLNYFCNTLEENHKNLFARIKKEDFIAEKQQLLDNIEGMSDVEFYFSLKHLLALVGDAHSNVYYAESNYKHMKALGFAIAKFEDDWRLLMLESKNEKYLGYKLTGINDINIETIYERAKAIMSFENEVWAESQFSNTINFKDALEYLKVVDKNGTIVLNIENEAGDRFNLEINDMSEAEIEQAEIISLNPKKQMNTAPTGFYNAKELDENNYYIQYNRCQEAYDLSIKEFIKVVKNNIKKQKYKNIIIDLRYNGGGNSRVFEPMIQTLKELENEKGFKVYTLIGKSTFSSAIINAVQLKDQLNCKLVGTPTGGNVNGYGELEFFHLKNHPIQVSYSTKYFELIKDYDKDSLYPDVILEISYKDYINGIDPAIEYIKSSN